MKILCTLFAMFAITAILCVSVNYEYDTRNQLINCIYSNDYTITYSYDDNSNLTSQVITQPNATPMSPTQFCLTINDGQAFLSWEPVTSNINGTPIIVPLYLIEVSSQPTAGFTQIGMTSQTHYTISSENYQHRFFRVRAVVNYQRDNVQPAVQADTITTEIRNKE